MSNSFVQSLYRRIPPVVVASALAALLILFPGSALGLSTTVSADKSGYLLGELVQFTASVTFDEGEIKNINSVTLVVNGNQGVSQVLPLAEGTYSYPDNNLSVSVSWTDITAVSGYGGYSYGYEGTSASSKIDYAVTWDSPILLDPPPTYSLVPNTVVAFDVPQLSAAALPSGLPDPLPALTTGFDLPALAEVDPNAPDPLPSLTGLATALMLATDAVPGAPADLPDEGDITDKVADIPTVTDDLISGISVMPDSTAFITGITGMLDIELDDSGNLYVLAEGTPDTITKYDSSGTLVSAFGTSGVADIVTDGTVIPTANVTDADSIAIADDKLWVSHSDSNLDKDEGQGPMRYWLQFSITDGSSVTACRYRQNWQSDASIDPITGNGDYVWGYETSNDSIVYYDVDDDCDTDTNNNSGFDLENNWGEEFANGEAIAFAHNGSYFYKVDEDGGIYSLSLLPGANPGWEDSLLSNSITGFTSDVVALEMDSSGAIYIGNSDSGVIAKTQGSSTLTTSPRGLTYDSDNEYFYLLVNGSGGNDRLLKLDSDMNMVGTSIDTGTGDAEALAFLDGEIWLTFSTNNGNDAKAKPYNISNTAWGSTVSLSTQWGGTSHAGATSDGDTIFNYAYDSGSWMTFDDAGDTDEQGECQSNRCSVVGNGATAAAYDSDKENYYVAKNGDLVLIALNSNNSEERASYLDLTYDGEDIKIKGMTIVSGVVYMADSEEDQILKASIPTGETTTPLALTNDGTHLWAVTNGTGGADTLLQLNASTGAKVNGFTMEVDDVTGITHDGDDLWVLVSTQNGCSMQKIDPSDGSNDGQSVTMTQGWCNGYGGISHDGDDFWVVQQSQNRVESYDDSGNSQTDLNVDAWLGGGRAIAVSGSGQVWIARGSDIDAFTADGMNMQQVSGMQQEDMETTVGEDLDVAGMTWMGSVLYIADDETDTIYKTAAPAGANNILGLADDGTDLYVLVNNAPTDSIMKVSTAGVKDTSWGTNGVISTDTSAASGITLHGSNLWVVATEQNNYGGDTWGFTSYGVSDGSPGTGFSENNIPYGNASANGLMSDGTNIFVGHSQIQDSGVKGYDAQGMSTDQIYLQQTNSVQGLAYRSQSPEIVAVTSTDVKTFDTDGTLYDSFSTNLTNIKGVTAIGHVVYIGEADGNTVKMAAIPLPTQTITTEPKGMADDGTDLYMVIEANPKDYIAKLTTGGALVESFGTNGAVQAPKDDITGITYADDALWVLTSAAQKGSCPPNCGGGGLNALVLKLDKDTGEQDSSFEISNCNYGPCFDFNGITTDGPNLLIAASESCGYNCGQMKLYVVSTSNTSQQEEKYVSGQPSDIDSIVFYDSSPDKLFTFNGSEMRKFNYSGSSIDTTGQVTLAQAPDIKGSAYIGTDMLLAGSYYDVNAQGQQGYVRSTTLSINIPELTIIGSYAATLVAVTPETTATSSAAQFLIEKATSTTVEVTSPASGFSVFEPAVNITGTVNDPAVETVSVGVDLPFTSLFADGGEDGAVSTGKYTKNGLWNLACGTNAKMAAGDCAWYYGATSSKNYETGSQNSGSLQLGEDISVISEDIVFKFDTWWDTEPGADYDRKMVQVSEDSGATWDTVAAIIGPFDINPQTEAPWSVPGEMSGVSQWLQVPQAMYQFAGGPCPPYCGNDPSAGGGGMYGGDPYGGDPSFGGGGGNPEFSQVVVDLSDYVGETIKIRFHFDTMDAYVNALEGWYIDNITIGGAGFDGVTAAVTPVTDPALKATGVYGTYSTTFNLAEGINTITVVAENPYDSELEDEAEIEGFLDTTPPVVVLTPISSPTSAATATVAGTIGDINFQDLTIQQTTTLGTKTIVTVKTLPEDGTFTKVAGLTEGTNTFTATAKDGAGLEASATVSVVLDTVGPELTVNDPSYPIGATSARQGEPVIFSVDASATGAGVDKVEILFPKAGGGGNDVAEFKPSADVPDAIRDLWGVEGGYILATKIPDTASPGTYSLTIQATDTAGNVTTDTVEAAVVASLQGYNINLMPDWNLVSLPLMPTDSDIDVLTDGVDGIESVWYYDAQKTLEEGETASDRWLVYTPADDDVDTLDELETGRGYWFKMDDTVFTLSSPLAPGLPHTPQAIKLTYTGQFVEPGTLPPSYTIVEGWNSMGFHSENQLPVTTALQSLESPQRIWGSLLQYNNRIVFTISDTPGVEPTFEILLGAFQRILSTDNLTPGYGYWIFMVDDGVITP